MDSYRAQAAIANALLIHYLDLSDNKILNTKKVAFLLIQSVGLWYNLLIYVIETILSSFDNLVQQAIVLDNTPGVQQLNILVKCLLYMRIGDFIVGISLTENKLVCFLCFNRLNKNYPELNPDSKAESPGTVFL